MFPPALTVIDGNPDAAPLESADHLTLVILQPSAVETAPRSLRLRLVDTALSFLSGLRLRLEFMRDRIEKEASIPYDPDRQYGGREW